MYRLRSKRRQTFHRGPVRRCLVALEQAGGAEDQRAGAYRSNEARLLSPLLQEIKRLSIFHYWEHPRATRHEKNVQLGRTFVHGCVRFDANAAVGINYV